MLKSFLWILSLFLKPIDVSTKKHILTDQYGMKGLSQYWNATQCDTSKAWQWLNTSEITVWSHEKRNNRCPLVTSMWWLNGTSNLYVDSKLSYFENPREKKQNTQVYIECIDNDKNITKTYIVPSYHSKVTYNPSNKANTVLTTFSLNDFQNLTKLKVNIHGEEFVGQISRFQLYQIFCDSVVTELVNFTEKLAPGYKEEPLVNYGECVMNAVPEGGVTPSSICYPNGTIFVMNSCKCKQGFKRFNQTCVAVDAAISKEAIPKEAIYGSLSAIACIVTLATCFLLQRKRSRYCFKSRKSETNNSPVPSCRNNTFAEDCFVEPDHITTNDIDLKFNGYNKTVSESEAKLKELIINEQKAILETCSTQKTENVNTKVNGSCGCDDINMTGDDKFQWRIQGEVTLNRPMCKRHYFKKLYELQYDDTDTIASNDDSENQSCCNAAQKTLPIELMESREYDVFICYSSNDRDWVKNTLLYQLENRGVRVCIDYRDFLIGAYIVENIADAIYGSRKTIAVLSPDFLASVYCKHELKTALSRMANHQVVPVLYKQCDIPQVLQDKTYLDWQHTDVKPYFWDALVKAIYKNADS